MSKTKNGNLDLVLRVMDHQLVGPSGALLGNVDNLVLREDDQALTVVGLLAGPGGFGPRQPGLFGEWIVAVWKRLSTDEDPRPLMVPMSHVRDIGSAITVSDYAERALQQTSGLEQWLRRHVISALPGAKGGGDDRLTGTISASAAGHHELTRPPNTQLLSDLLGGSVVDGSGRSLGTVIELRARPLEQTGLEVGRLQVMSLVFGPHRLGGELGYTTVKDQGPWLLARAFRWWHRRDREAQWNDIATVRWDQRLVTLAPVEGLPHPFAISDPGN
ncbi:hypothetical protein [Phycicoccus sp. Root101]|uniref:hypothetical protein n=1 Tax=Phycicoccus sp. Root101 TaxID=1736421 RepID=UPI000A4EF613|nr:hypothetical protein [Phycicoccus sp. Root101]